MGFRFKEADLGLFNSTDASEALRGFKKGCRLMGLTRGLFSLIDLIHAVLVKTGPADVVCVTWSAGIKDAHQVQWMVRSDLIRSFQIVTDRSYRTRQPKYAVAISDLFGEENIRVTDIHAKFVLIANADHKVTIRTSMNLNANKTCENFEIDEDPAIYEFYNSFVSKVIDKAPPGWDGRRQVVEAVLEKIFREEAGVRPGEFLKRRRAVRNGFMREV